MSNDHLWDEIAREVEEDLAISAKDVRAKTNAYKRKIAELTLENERLREALGAAGGANLEGAGEDQEQEQPPAPAATTEQAPPGEKNQGLEAD